MVNIVELRCFHDSGDIRYATEGNKSTQGNSVYFLFLNSNFKVPLILKMKRIVFFIRSFKNNSGTIHAVCNVVTRVAMKWCGIRYSLMSECNLFMEGLLSESLNHY